MDPERVPAMGQRAAMGHRVAFGDRMDPWVHRPPRDRRSGAGAGVVEALE
jgi:hypothetical protein